MIIQFLGDGYLADNIPLTTLVKLGDLGLSLGIECFRDPQTSALGEVPAELAFCFAIGKTARTRALDRDLIEVGRSADVRASCQQPS